MPACLPSLPACLPAFPACERSRPSLSSGDDDSTAAALLSSGVPRPIGSLACLRAPLLSLRQMGVLCVAVEASSCRRRVLIATGGDDHAICVAEVQVSEGSAGELSAVLVGGSPDLFDSAAYSAIKGIALIPSLRVTTSPGEGAGDTADATPACYRRCFPPSLTVFSVSRDQRLSRWELVAAPSPEPPPQGETEHGCDKQAGSTLLGGRAGRGPRAPEGRRMHGRRWALRWRAGCVTDVCDVSDMDVMTLHPEGVFGSGARSRPPRRAGASPRAAGEDEYEYEETAPVQAGGKRVERSDRGEACVVSPAALIAVSGQGLQLVAFAEETVTVSTQIVIPHSEPTHTA